MFTMETFTVRMKKRNFFFVLSSSSQEVQAIAWQFLTLSHLYGMCHFVIEPKPEV